MNQFCPISYSKVDENVIRINSTLVFILSLLIFIIPYQFAIFLSFFLIIDFFTKGFGNSDYSVLNNIGKFISRVLALPQKKINSGPKIFAAQIGGFISVAITAGVFFNFTILMYSTVSILAFCAFMEAAFAFCVACKIYPFFRKIYPETSFDSSQL